MFFYILSVGEVLGLLGVAVSIFGLVWVARSNKPKDRPHR